MPPTPRLRSGGLVGWVFSLTFAACSESGQVLAPADPIMMPPPVVLETTVSAGDNHTCAVTNGRLRCWGSNEHGQLGLGNDDDQLRPSEVAIDRSFLGVSAAEGHTCGLTTTNEVYCWGWNERGQLGVGTRTASSRPERVTLPQGAVQVSADFLHTCAVLSDGALYCWGENSEGQLGQGDTPQPGNEADRSSPALVPGGPYQYVDSGQGHTCAIKRDRTLWCWGRNSFHESSAVNDEQLRSPQQVGTGSDWLTVDAGQNHTCALRLDRSLWCWGRNTASERDEGYPLGIDGAAELANPTPVESGVQWLNFSTDTFHTCATDRAHNVWCWGRNQEGQLGLDDTQSRPTPVLVQANVASADAGRFSGCIVGTDGKVRCAGKNDSGQLGTGDTERTRIFTEVAP